MTLRSQTLATFLFILALAICAVPPTDRASAASNQAAPTGQLTVVGRVTVNGQPAATGDTISSGSVVAPAKGSSAVVSLGKLGRVEALPETRMKLRFDDTSISILLGAGSVKVSTGPGVVVMISHDSDR